MDARQSIDLVSIEEPQVLKKAVSQPDPVIQKPLPPKQKPAISTAPPKEVKPISIKPLKKKIVKNKPVEPTIQEKKKLEELNKKYLEEAAEAKRLAEEAEKLAALEAVNQLKQMLKESQLLENTPQKNPNTTISTPRVNRGIIESRYFASIVNKLQAHWSLPEYKIWDPNLMAIVVIQIEKDGTISNQFFEQKSGDRLFDQFVLKTLQDSSPLPEIPVNMDKKSLEIGFRFRPGSIQF